MPEYDYHVVIRKIGTQKNTSVTGTLTYTFSKYDTNTDFLPKEECFTLEFNPLTVLGDLRNKEKPFEYFEERLNIDRSWKFLLGSYEYEYGFEKPLYIGNDVQYLKFISNLDRIMRENECTTLVDLIEIQKEYHLNLDCHLFVEENSNFHELLQKKYLNKTKTIYKPLEYKFGEINDFLETSTYMNRNHQFYYHCHNMADVIFSILHFLVMHKYEFKTCALCQKRYAKISNHGQGKYCPRKSPLGSYLYFDERITNEKFKGLDCQASMRKFHEIMRNKKKGKLRYVPDDEQANIFINTFDMANDKVKESPIIKNLIDLYSFMKQYKFNS